MKIKKYLHLKVAFVGLAFLSLVGCERELSDEAEFATFSTIGEIFTDSPIGLGTDFYFPFLGAKPDAFSVDENESYQGTASIRIDVPNANDPSGNFAGAIFRIDGAGRNLTGYDALTFYAKASQGVVIGEIGFGQDFEENKYLVTANNTSLSTNWVKYVIPIPDPSKLIEERGVLWFAAGTQDTGGLGYTFWMDEVRFEKLGNIAQPKPAIFNGDDVTIQSFIGSTIPISGLTQTFNLATGQNVTVSAAPSYFNFSSSDIEVARVSQLGLVTIIGAGDATITGAIANVNSKGSLSIESLGNLPSAPVPTRPEANVLSIYSDAYTPVTGINFNPGFGGSTTETTEGSANGDSILIYTNNNFTGIIFDSPVDASVATHMHIDIYTLNPDLNLEIQIRDVGANGELETDVNNGQPIGDDVDLRFTPTGITSGSWNSYDIPLDGNLASQRNNLGALILAAGPDFILDNIYFYNK